MAKLIKLSTTLFFAIFVSGCFPGSSGPTLSDVKRAHLDSGLFSDVRDLECSPAKEKMYTCRFYFPEVRTQRWIGDRGACFHYFEGRWNSVPKRRCR